MLSETNKNKAPLAHSSRLEERGVKYLSHGGTPGERLKSRVAFSRMRDCLGN